MNIGVAKVFQIGAKLNLRFRYIMVNDGSCTAKAQHFFHKLKRKVVNCVVQVGMARAITLPYPGYATA